MKKAALLTSLVMVGMGTAYSVNAELYLGGQGTYSWLNDACAANSPCDKTWGSGLFAGYEFNDSIAIELGYDRLGHLNLAADDGVTTASVADDLNAFTFGPKFSTAVTQRVGGYIKLGLAQVDFADNSGNSLFGSIGGEYFISDQWTARMEFRHIDDIDDGVINNISADSVFLGIAYKFGRHKALPVVAAVANTAMVTPASNESISSPTVNIKTFKEFSVKQFAFDHYDLSDESKDYFDWLATIMLKYPQASAVIVGHTDAMGSEEYNQRLSEKRAASSANYLIGVGVDGSRISFSGKGEQSPIATNDTGDGRKQNRRVEVSVEEFQYQDNE